MSTPRVYHPHPLHPGQTLVLAEAAGHHLGRVLRAREGDALVLFDGIGGEHTAVVERVSRRGVEARVGAHRAVERESPLDLSLAQVISSGDRMDYTVQKAVELGVRAIRPLMSLRGKVRLDPERAARRVAHWQGIAVAACEQCGRNRVPQVLPVQAFYDWVATADATCLLLSPRAEQRLAALPRPTGSITLIAGGESGLAPEEEREATRRGGVPVRLGPRILRTETAALVALAAMQALWGDV